MKGQKHEDEGRGKESSGTSLRSRRPSPLRGSLNETMDLLQLRYFTEVARQGSVSAAARVCGLSQPGMSLRMNELETRLSEQLLRRGSKGVALTEAGRLLLEHAERLLEGERQLRSQFEAREDLKAGHVAFGIIPTLAPYLLPKMLANFRKEYPGIEIEVMENQTARLIELIGVGELEFAILSDVTAEDQRRYGLKMEELFREPLLLGLSRRHPLALREDDPVPGDLVAEELIHLSDGHCLRDQVLKACRLDQTNRKMQCDQLETALAMVAADLGITVVPKLAVESGVRDGIVIRSFQKPWPTRTVYVLKKKAVKMNKAAEKLVRVLKGSSI